VARPLDGPGVARRVAPFLAVAAAAMVMAVRAAAGEPEQVVGVGSMLAILSVSMVLPWRRMPTWTQAVPAFAGLVWVAQLQNDFGTASSGFTPLAVLPVVWLALHGTRRQMYTSVAGLGAALLVPLLLQGPSVTVDDWRRAVLWVLVGLVLGPTLHALVATARRGERAARTAASRLDGAFSALLDGAVILRALRDEHGTVDDFLIEYAKLPEDSPTRAEDLVDHRVSEFERAHPSGLLDRYLEVVATGAVRHWVQPDPRPGREGESYEVSAAPTTDGVAVVYRAVTDDRPHDRPHDRRRDLAVSAVELRSAFENAPAGMAVVTLDGMCIRANDALAQIVGVPRRDLVGGDLTARLTAPDRRRMVVQAERIRAGRAARSRVEVAVPREGDEILHASVRCSMVRDAEGTPSHYLLYVSDRGPQYRQEEVLRREKDFTTAVIETAGTPIVVLDDEARVARFNAAAQHLTGYGPEEVVGRYLWEVLFPPDRRPAVQLGFCDVTGRGVPLAHEEDWLTRDGRRRRIAWSNGFLTDEQGRRTHVVMTGIDVTDERAAKNLFASVIEAATATAIIGTDRDGVITVFNSGAERLLGWTAAELVGTATPLTLHDPAQIASAAADLAIDPGLPVLFAEVDAGGRPETRDWTWVRKDGSRRTVSMTVSVMRDTFGTRQGYLGVAEDVTQRRHAEGMVLSTLAKEREAAERLREIDRVKTDFVSSISHELRTPITSIVGYLEMLQDGVAGPLHEEQLELLQIVHRNSHRLLSLIEDLLTLSRIESGAFRLEVRRLDLREVAEAAREALAPIFANRDLNVEFRTGADPMDIDGDAGQLERVMMNLLTNAVKFTEDGGDITLSLTRDGDTVVLEVVDSGIGIPEAEQGHLFDKFFRSSTARQRAIQGTGLGLSIVQSIVQGHGGTVQLHSRPQVGTTVRVTLPCHAAEDVPPDRARSAAGLHEVVR